MTYDNLIQHWTPALVILAKATKTLSVFFILWCTGFSYALSLPPPPSANNSGGISGNRDIGNALNSESMSFQSLLGDINNGSTLGGLDQIIQEQKILESRLKLKKMQDQINSLNGENSNMVSNNIHLAVPATSEPVIKPVPLIDESINYQGSMQWMQHVFVLSIQSWNGLWTGRLLMPDNSVRLVHQGDELGHFITICRINQQGVWFKNNSSIAHIHQSQHNSVHDCSWSVLIWTRQESQHNNVP